MFPPSFSSLFPDCRSPVLEGDLLPREALKVNNVSYVIRERGRGGRDSWCLEICCVLPARRRSLFPLVSFSLGADDRQILFRSHTYTGWSLYLDFLRWRAISPPPHACFFLSCTVQKTIYYFPNEIDNCSKQFIRIIYTYVFLCINYFTDLYFFFYLSIFFS